MRCLSAIIIVVPKHTFVDNEPFLEFEALQEFSELSDSVAVTCKCNSPALCGWTSMPASFPENQLRRIGTLVRESYDEPTFEEYHPHGTSFWAIGAPIAPRFHPYDRCEVHQCAACSRVYLRYVEGGGYYVDIRIRRLAANVLVDATTIVPAP